MVCWIERRGKKKNKLLLKSNTMDDEQQKIRQKNVIFPYLSTILPRIVPPFPYNRINNKCRKIKCANNIILQTKYTLL